MRFLLACSPKQQHLRQLQMLKSKPGLDSGPYKSDCMVNVESTVEVDYRDSIVAKQKACYVCLTYQDRRAHLDMCPKKYQDVEIKSIFETKMKHQRESREQESIVFKFKRLQKNEEVHRRGYPSFSCLRECNSADKPSCGSKHCIYAIDNNIKSAHDYISSKSSHFTDCCINS